MAAKKYYRLKLWLFSSLIASTVVAQDNPTKLSITGVSSGRPAYGNRNGVQPDPDGEHLWIIERCSANQCAGSDHHPIHKLDMQGKTVKSIGAGLFAWPHGFDMDEKVIFGLQRCSEGTQEELREQKRAWATKWLKSIKRVRF